MKSGIPPKKLTWITGIAAISFLFIVWYTVTARQWVDAVFLPSPGRVMEKIRHTATEGFMGATLWEHSAQSLYRMLGAAVTAVVTGVPLGIAMGLNPWVRGFLDPLIETYRPLPPLAYLPLLVIWLGIGEETKILLIYLAILPPIIISTVQGMQVAQGNRIHAVRSLGANRRDILRYVLLPAALPNILTGIRIGLGVGWSTLVAAELIAATRGLGFMVQSAAQFLMTDVVIGGIIVIALIAVGIEICLRRIQKELAPWEGKA